MLSYDVAGSGPALMLLHSTVCDRRMWDPQWPVLAEPAEVAVDLHAITAPSLLVSGAKDLPDFPLIAAELAGLLPDARLIELPWAGHLPTLERPDEMSQLLTAFLRDTVSPG